jgi:hypothetical protein
MRGLGIALVSVLVVASSACSSAEPVSGSPPSDETGDAGTPDVAAGAVDGGGSTPADVGTEPLGVRFKIQLDYRFDKAGFFADPVRKQALEGACRIWGRLLSDSFGDVPKGTFIRVRDPEKPSDPALSFDIDYAIDDLLLFVGSAELPSGTTGISSPTAGLSGVTDGTLRSALDQRFNGTPFQPWTAWVAFDRTTDFHFDPAPELNGPVPAGKLDFVSVALHEIGHVLGFGTSEAFNSRIVAGSFTGTKTTALFGGPLPLSPDLGHVPITTLSGGARMLMDVSDAAGTRYLPTPLDKAMFADLGYHF